MYHITIFLSIYNFFKNYLLIFNFQLNKVTDFIIQFAILIFILSSKILQKPLILFFWKLSEMFTTSLLNPSICLPILISIQHNLTHSSFFYKLDSNLSLQILLLHQLNSFLQFSLALLFNEATSLYSSSKMQKTYIRLKAIHIKKCRIIISCFFLWEFHCQYRE